MKKTSFTFGAIAGATSLAMALPMVTPLASAATDTGATLAKNTRPIPTQECVLALAERDSFFLTNADTMMAARKAATVAHRDALIAAAALNDDAERQEALKKANEDFRTVMKATHNAADHAAVMEALKAACGDSFHGGFGMGMKNGQMHDKMMKGGMKNMLTEKLGMTADEIKAARGSGKTIEDIATEKGVTLPAREAKGKKGKRGMMRFMHEAKTNNNQ